MDYYRETMSSRPIWITAPMKSAATKTGPAQVQNRTGPSTDREKWTRAPTPTKKLAAVGIGLQRKKLVFSIGVLMHI